MTKIGMIAVMATLCLGVACKKDKDDKGEKPLQTVLDDKKVIDTVYQITNNAFEIGYKFYASKDGKVTHLGCYMPYKGDFRVSLWDFTSKNLLAAVTVKSDSSDFVYADIDDVALVANTRYVVSLNNYVNGDDRTFFVAEKKSVVPPIYPFSTGSITFESLLTKTSNVSVFPDGVSANNQRLIAGFPDFIFR